MTYKSGKLEKKMGKANLVWNVILDNQCH